MTENRMVTAELLENLGRDFFDTKYTSHEETVKYCAAAFEALQGVKDTGSDGYREFWIEVPRGEFDDDEDWDEKEREAEYRYWLERYPNPTLWFKLSLQHYKSQYVVSANSKFIVCAIGNPEEQYDVRCDDLSFVAKWVFETVKEVVSRIKSGA
jgi:hypothetical protein